MKGIREPGPHLEHGTSSWMDSECYWGQVEKREKVSGCFRVLWQEEILKRCGKVTCAGGLGRKCLSLMKDKQDPGSSPDLLAAGRAGDRAGSGAFTFLASPRGCVQ